jgi:hypothetical protein
MGKGSGRRPQNISDEELEKAWNAIFAGHPNEDDFEKVKKDIVKRKEDVIKEDGYGNELPKANDPDRFVDDTGDA